MNAVVRLIAFFAFFGLARDAFGQPSMPRIDPKALDCVRSGGTWRASQPVLFGTGDHVVRFYCICPSGRVNALTLEDCPVDGAFDLCVSPSAPRPWNTRAEALVPSAPASSPPALANAVAPARPRRATSTPEVAEVEPLESDDMEIPPLPPPAPASPPPAPVPAPAPAAPPAPAPIPVPVPAPAPAPPTPCADECSAPKIYYFHVRDIFLYAGLGATGFAGGEHTVKLGSAVNLGLWIDFNSDANMQIDVGPLYTGNGRYGVDTGFLLHQFPWRRVGYGIGARGQWANLGIADDGSNSLRAEILNLGGTAGLSLRNNARWLRVYAGALVGKSVFEDGTPWTLGGYGSVGVTF